ncbi:2-(5''-triphosphoribosyl)-3'-dephospho-CoA synthase [Pandoraea thiooxydans]|uniref:Probable 2-(5''-triphosphoribosyl)-3'-dephosphocoenzyme-A synthase n=1 Tax=Pandoraea thiooxydans TaxID=445709 RepID=A0A0G3ETP8_9BURK|nr:triphosphoribosyl-dephospho-CoA synthase [Pandoraea thiooxydans]AKJ68076.1 triphosphoribosyl-dephospho-CoA synthase MdcB [Pandoraea thiooxydans]APR95333.1 2-(5''-triphosphoribosyl)-3'-dephospho-CoA synthase [Pandoraea thiooxydans]
MQTRQACRRALAPLGAHPAHPATPAAHRAAARLARDAVAALLDEVMLTPKPGLVDLGGRGAHDDLSWPLMCRSACALLPSFHAMALASWHAPLDGVLRERVGALGRHAEAAMLHATAGVNTHRGAIWALGLLVSAAAQHPAERAAHVIAGHAGALARLTDRHAPASTGHKGEQACLTYGVGGARAQAQAGFPHVVNAALPALWQARARGDHENAARLNALLAVMASLDDTCVLARGGPAALGATQAGAQAVLDAGGAATLPGRRALAALVRRLLALRVSPGGAADLLAAALFLDRRLRPAQAASKA